MSDDPDTTRKTRLAAVESLNEEVRRERLREARQLEAKWPVHPRTPDEHIRAILDLSYGDESPPEERRMPSIWRR